MRRITGLVVAGVISTLLVFRQVPAQAEQSTSRSVASLLFGSTDVGTLKIKLDWYDVNDDYVTNDAVFSESNTMRNDWTFAGGSAIAPANAVRVNVYFDYFGVLNSCTELDDVSLIGLVPDGSYTAEILSNGGFELGNFTDWPGTSTGGTPAAVLSGSAHSGSFYARTGQYLFTKHYEIKASTSYSASAWYKTITCLQRYYLPLLTR